MLLQVWDANEQRLVGAEIALADTFGTRLKGLLGRKNLQPGQGLLINPCSSIHSIGMKFAFDAVFLDRDQMVIRVAENVAPNRVGPVVPKAKYTLELPAGTVRATGMAVGHRLVWKPCV